jgi:acyl-CoA synthetase (NDP forming)
VYRYSELAVDAMALAADWHTRRQGAAHTAEDVAAGTSATDGVDWVALRRTVRADAAVTGRGWLPPAAVARVLEGAAIPSAAAGVATNPAEAATLTERLVPAGGAVVMKAVVPGLMHKTEAGGVVLGVVGGAAAAATYADFQARFTDLAGALVQAQVPAGPEVLVGGRQDPVAGPLVVVAAGGIEAELLADRVVRAAPFSVAVAEELLLSLRTSPRLTGFRGQPRADVGALAALVARVAQLVAVVPEVVEFEVNPVVASTAGAVALDTRVRVDPDAGVPVPLRGN